MSSDGTPLPVVRKSNLLIESICKATTNEKRVVMTAASKVHMNDPIGKTYSFHLSEIKKLLTVKNDGIYSDLREAIIGIKRRDLWLKQEDGEFELTNWFSWVRYDEKTMIFSYRFDQSVHEFLAFLGEHYTSYLLSNALSLNKAHYITLFELLKSYEYKGRGGKFYRELEIEYLRDILNLRDTGYERFFDIKRFIVEPAIKAINKHTDINIYNVQYIKTGRSYTSICFYCEPSNQIRMVVDTFDNQPEQQAEKPKDENQIDLVDYIEESTIKEKLLKHGIIAPVAQKFIKNLPLEQIERNINYTLEQQQKGTVKDFLRYLHDAIENDYAKNWKSENTIKNEEQKKSNQDRKKQALKVQKEEDTKAQERAETLKAQEIFDTLTAEEQADIVEAILVDLKANGGNQYMFNKFDNARKTNTVHQEPMFYANLKRVMRGRGEI